MKQKWLLLEVRTSLKVKNFYLYRWFYSDCSFTVVLNKMTRTYILQGSFFSLVDLLQQAYVNYVQLTSTFVNLYRQRVYRIRLLVEHPGCLFTVFWIIRRPTMYVKSLDNHNHVLLYKIKLPLQEVTRSLTITRAHLTHLQAYRL